MRSQRAHIRNQDECANRSRWRDGRANIYRMRNFFMIGKAIELKVDPRLVEKGRRKGVELRWADLVSCDAALAAALQASVAGAG